MKHRFYRFRFYRLLLRAHPPATRAELAPEMERAFGDVCAEHQGRRLGLAAAMLREAVDVVRSGIRERRGGGDLGGPEPPRRRGRRLGEDVLSDVRLALRALVAHPLAALVAVLTLALGIGATTAMFGLVDATLLRPFGAVAAPGELVAVYDFTRGRYGASSYPDYRDLRASTAFSGLAANRAQPVALEHDGVTERLVGQFVSASYFDVVGVRMGAGRGFRPEEEEGIGAHPVVVISSSLWERRFGARSDLVGTDILLNGRSLEVVGIAPPGFRGTALQAPPDLWLPMVMLSEFTDTPFGAEILDFRGLMGFSIVGRRAGGVSLEAAQAAVDLKAVEIEAAAPGMFDTARVFRVLPAEMGAFQPAQRGSVIRYTGVLLVVVGALLLVASINIGALLSVRAISRRREIAVRLALGAGRVRIVRQLATEGLVLALLGGVAALAVAHGSLPLLEALRLPAGLDPDLSLDGWLLAFNMGLALVAGLAFGVLPAVGASRDPGLMRVNEASSRHVSGWSGRSALVIAQVAVSVVLLAGAGLLGRSVWNLHAVERGFDPSKVLIAGFDLDQAGYDEAGGRRFFTDLVERLTAVDGVAAASIGTDVPLGAAAGAQPLFIDGIGVPEPGTVHHSLIGAGYFSTLGVEIVAGREFSGSDRDGSPGVVVVNQAMARLFWPGEDPRGRFVRLEEGGDPFAVVGVVRDYRHTSLRADPQPRLYWSIEQQYRFAKGIGSRTVLVRTEGAPLQSLAAIRTVVRDLDPGLPLFGITTLAAAATETIAEERQSAFLLAAFSILALLLSALGLFGVLAHLVGERRREIGVRCALGATGGDVAGAVIRQGVGMATAGVAVGLLAALAATRVLRAWLFGVEPFDPATFGAIALVVVVVAIAASYLPARRASRVDPAVALRSQ